MEPILEDSIPLYLHIDRFTIFDFLILNKLSEDIDSIVKGQGKWKISADVYVIEVISEYFCKGLVSFDLVDHPVLFWEEFFDLVEFE